MNKIFAILLLFSSVISLSAQTGDTIRICTWNLRGYDTAETEERKESIRKVLNEIDADILVIQGTSFKKRDSLTIYSDIIKDLNYNEQYTEIPEVDTVRLFEPKLIEVESKLYYRKSKLAFLETITRQCDYFNYNFISRFTFKNQSITDTLNIYAALFDPDNYEVRSDCAGQIFVEVSGTVGGPLANPKNPAIVAGSLFFRSSEEKAYRKIYIWLTDPLSTAWQPDSTEFLSTYTNSSRDENSTGCGGISTQSGLSKRHDYIFHMDKFIDTYIPNSYTVFGNDGLDRRTSSITDPPNQKVSQEIAEALECASSHLPVYADYVFGKATSIEETSAQTFNLSATPNPASAQSLITFTLLKESAVKLSVFDAAGREVLKLFSGLGSPGENRFVWNTENLPQGAYFLRLEADGKSMQVQCAVVR